jgi:hypothetical protein
MIRGAAAWFGITITLAHAAASFVRSKTPMTISRDTELIAGSYRLTPGVGVAGERPLLAPGRLAQVLRGQRPDDVPGVIASLFTLCGHAHRDAARLALAAARDAGSHDERSVSLVLETARDHLRTIALEWPQRIVPTPVAPALDWLRGCPLPIAGRPAASNDTSTALLSRFSGWFEQSVLREPADAWLAAHGDAASLATWCAERAKDVQPAFCLDVMRPHLDSWRPAARCLVLSADAQQRGAELRRLAADLRAEPAFAQQPLWCGEPAENGPWARMRDAGTGAWLTTSAWTRLCSRWIELVRIAAAARSGDAGGLLGAGCVALEPGCGIGWCEMARGTLFHWTRLDASGSVCDWVVIAPTEWNFHPRGVLSHCVRELPAGDADTAFALAAAFDPCVPCRVGPPEP